MEFDDDIPDAHFGSVKKQQSNWRSAADDDSEDDDEPLAKTPADVTGMLGFDPLELEDAK